MKWSLDGKLSVFMKPANGSNGMMFDTKGNLYACADEKNELWRIAPDKKVTVLVKDYQGKLLHAPNDWLRPGDGLEFTDPGTSATGGTAGPQEHEVQGVYYLGRRKIRPARGALTGRHRRTRNPNGITGKPGGKTLYVSDPTAKPTYVYDTRPDGSALGHAVPPRPLPGMGNLADTNHRRAY